MKQKNRPTLKDLWQKLVADMEWAELDGLTAGKYEWHTPAVSVYLIDTGDFSPLI